MREKVINTIGTAAAGIGAAVCGFGAFLSNNVLTRSIKTIIWNFKMKKQMKYVGFKKKHFWSRRKSPYDTRTGEFL